MEKLLDSPTQDAKQEEIILLEVDNNPDLKTTNKKKKQEGDNLQAANNLEINNKDKGKNEVVSPTKIITDTNLDKNNLPSKKNPESLQPSSIKTKEEFDLELQKIKINKPARAVFAIIYEDLTIMAKCYDKILIKKAKIKDYFSLISTGIHCFYVCLTNNIFELLIKISKESEKVANSIANVANALNKLSVDMSDCADKTVDLINDAFPEENPKKNDNNIQA